MQKSKIVALALIGIMLSSSSVSVADGYTIWIDTREVNLSQSLLVAAKPQNYKINLFDAVDSSNIKKIADTPESYVINLNDGVTGSFVRRVYDKGIPITVNLLDGITSAINDAREQSLNNKKQKIISINLSDCISADNSDNDEADSKIIHIKHADERKALWERIFPLDRIRNNVKSFYQIIQNHHSLSYIQ